MGAGDLTMLDLRNILEWYELISDKNLPYSGEQYLRTKVKVHGYLVSMEDSSEPLASDLIGTIVSGLESAKYSDLQYARSLLENRLTRINEDIKSLSALKDTVDKRIGETKQ